MDERRLGCEQVTGDDDTISNQVDRAFMLIDVVSTLHKDLRSANLREIHFVEYIQAELNWVLEKNICIGKSVNLLLTSEQEQSFNVSVKRTVAEITAEIKQAKKLLYDATLNSITKSSTSQRCCIRLEKSIYLLYLSTHRLHKRLKQLEQGSTDRDCRTR
jgi:hypothetical protein